MNRKYPLRQFHRYMLDPNLRPLYDSMSNMLENNKKEAIIYGKYDSSTLDKVLSAVQYDLPYIYRLDPDDPFDIRYTESYVKVMCNFKITHDQQESFNRQVDYLISEINNNCTTDYDKELFVHDWFVDNVTYLKDSGSIKRSEFTAYGAIVDRKAVCMGISKAVSLILNKVGVDCGTYSDESSNHIWNIIKIDGDDYHLDVTWDIPNEKPAPYRNYDFFNITDADMNKFHKIGVGLQFTATKYNWYIKNGYAVYCSEDILEIMKNKSISHGNYLPLRIFNMDVDEASDYAISFAKRLNPTSECVVSKSRVINKIVVSFR